jgi:hypothetical protein
MLGLAARLIGGFFTPLIDQASASTGRIVRKLALFVLAGVALIVVLIALTIAFYLWIASLRGPIVGALAVAGLYASIAFIAVLLALRSGGAPRSERATPTGLSGQTGGATDAEIDAFAGPLLAVLAKLGLRKEQLAVLAGTSVAKQMGPIPLVGLALVAGFLLGRMGRRIFPADLFASLMAASDLVADLLRPSSGAEGRSTESDPAGSREDLDRNAA